MTSPVTAHPSAAITALTMDDFRAVLSTGCVFLHKQISGCQSWRLDRFENKSCLQLARQSAEKNYCKNRQLSPQAHEVLIIASFLGLYRKAPTYLFCKNPAMKNSSSLRPGINFFHLAVLTYTQSALFGAALGGIRGIVRKEPGSFTLKRLMVQAVSASPPVLRATGIVSYLMAMKLADAAGFHISKALEIYRACVYLMRKTVFKTYFYIHPAFVLFRSR